MVECEEDAICGIQIYTYAKFQTVAEDGKLCIGSRPSVLEWRSDWDCYALKPNITILIDQVNPLHPDSFIFRLQYNAGLAGDTVKVYAFLGDGQRVDLATDLTAPRGKSWLPPMEIPLNKFGSKKWLTIWLEKKTGFPARYKAVAYTFIVFDTPDRPVYWTGDIKADPQVISTNQRSTVSLPVTNGEAFDVVVDISYSIDGAQQMPFVSHTIPAKKTIDVPLVSISSPVPCTKEVCIMGVTI